MNIVVGSAFRNFAGRVEPYMKRVAALKAHGAPWGARVRVIAVEGDSKDDTWGTLETHAIIHGIDVERVKHNHGGRVFGSTEHEDRMIAMSGVGNAIFESVKPTDDVLFYVEADLLWDPHTAGSLIDMAYRRDGGFDVFAPYVAAGPHFYDIWGFRMSREERFSPLYKGEDKEPFEVYSAGSCLAMRGEVARRCRIRNNYCLVGWCEDAREQGYSIACAPMFRVNHP